MITGFLRSMSCRFVLKLSLLLQRDGLHIPIRDTEVTLCTPGYVPLSPGLQPYYLQPLGRAANRYYVIYTVRD